MTQEQTPLEKHVAKYGLAELNQAADVVGMRVYTANAWDFTLQDGNGTTYDYHNTPKGIESAWEFLTLTCRTLNRTHPLNRGPRVLPPHTSTLPKVQQVSIATKRLDDIEMLFEMVDDWLEGFNGEQPEAYATLRYLQNSFFPERVPLCEDCGACNNGVGYHTEVHNGDRAQCLTHFKQSYQEAYQTPWPWPFYPGCCENCKASTDLVLTKKNGVLCVPCQEKIHG